MSLMQFLFSPSGRISRLPYWLFSFASFGISLVLQSFYLLILPSESDVSGGTLFSFFVLILLFIFSLFMFISSIMVSIKRCHDRGRSGWFLLLGLIPFVNIWVAIDLAFFAGTMGTNQYGRDPLRSREPDPKPHRNQPEDELDFGPFTNNSDDQYGSDSYGSQIDDAYPFEDELDNQQSSNEIFGMSPVELGILGVLLVVILGFGGYMGLQFLSNPQNPPVNQAIVPQVTYTPSPSVSPSATPTPTIAPIATITPIPGWSRFEFSDLQAEIWLPSSYQGGDPVAYPEIAVMTLETFLDNESFVEYAKGIISEPEVAFFAFDTEETDLIRYMFIYREEIPSDIDFTMEAYLEVSVEAISSPDTEVLVREIISTDYYSEVGMLVFEEKLVLEDDSSMNLIFSTHSIRVDNETWEIVFVLDKDEYSQYVSIIDKSMRSFYIQP